LNLNTFIQLSARGRQKALAAYGVQSAFFPLIAAVLSGSQHGLVFGDDADAPNQVYVEHAFGFAQMFGAITQDFENGLKKRLLEDKSFAPAKVRLYTPYLPAFLVELGADPLRSERRRFFLDRKVFANAHITVADARPVTVESVRAIDAAFGLVTRFWPSYEAFLANAHAVAVYAGKVPAAICYAAALENGKAEIDVLTVPHQRGRGFGIQAASAFVRHCLEKGIEPLWDCFTNNAGSLALASRLGFMNGPAPYPFFTIPH